MRFARQPQTLPPSRTRQLGRSGAMRDVRPDSQMVQMLHDGRSSRPQLDRSHTPREQAWRRQLAAWQGTPGTSPVQFALSTATVPPAVAPMTAAALSVWILANCSERVKRLVNEAQFQLDITWDDAIPGAVAQTDMHLDYTDAAGVAGTINLFLGTAAADMAALAYPLAAHVLRRQLAHFAGANDEDRASLQLAEDLLGERDGGEADRDGTRAEPGFGAHPLAGPERQMEQPVEHRAHRLRRRSGVMRFLDQIGRASCRERVSSPV